jgi:hypothetical protein
MPRVSANLTSNNRVSVTPHFLRRRGAIEALEGFIDPYAPGARLYGKIGNEITTGDKRKYDDQPNLTFVLDAGSLRYEGERRRTRTRVEENLVASTNSNNDQEDPDLLKDCS